MQQIKLENNGLTFVLEGTFYEISGPEGVTQSGSMITGGKTDDEICAMADKHFAEYIKGHTIEQTESDTVVKRVAYDENRGDYIQLQAIKTGEADYYIVQKGLTAYVLRDGLGDCTNGGISSDRKHLYILGCKTSPFYPSDLRECVQIVGRDIMGAHYVNAKPIVHPKRWYMAGGNFLYTGDSRYKTLTGISYPVAIHDRYEGR